MHGSKVVNRFLRRLLSHPAKTNTYKVSDFELLLSDGHPLPEYQRVHPNYDQFLPVLVKLLPETTVVIDVGANIGDTVAAMLGMNVSLEYVCIEADKEFFDILVKNVKSIKDVSPNAIIHTVNEFIGYSIDNVSLEGVAGTKNAILGGGNIRSKSLDSIVSELGLGTDVSHLKTDTDGFDYDVIRSGKRLLSSKPLVYFECQFDEVNQIEEYIKLINELIAYGYDSFAFFDNFGQYIGVFDNERNMVELMSYIHRQNNSCATRTMYYYDILAFDSVWESLVKNAISDYLAR